jgi:hypothetical protein
MATSSVLPPIAARVLLSAIFLVAGVAKLADLSGSLQALRDFGVPRSLARLGVALPVLELAVAVALLFTRTAHYGSWGALALLLVFIAAIGINLVRGRRPDCHCFGQMQSHPISRWTLGRNLVLALAAAWLVVLQRERPAADLWTYLATLHGRDRQIAIAIMGVIVFAVLSPLWRDTTGGSAGLPWWSDADDDEEPAPPAKAHSRPAPAPASAPSPQPGDALASPASTGLGLPVGTPAPPFALPDPEGCTHSLDDLRSAGKPLFLVFSSPHCGACQKLSSKLPALAARHASRVTMAMITREGAQEHITPGEHGPLLLIQRDGEVTEAYDCVTIPSAVIVDTDGIIQSPAAIGAPDIEALLASAGGAHQP